MEAPPPPGVCPYASVCVNIFIRAGPNPAGSDSGNWVSAYVVVVVTTFVYCPSSKEPRVADLVLLYPCYPHNNSHCFTCACPIEILNLLAVLGHMYILNMNWKVLSGLVRKRHKTRLPLGTFSFQVLYRWSDEWSETESISPPKSYSSAGIAIIVRWWYANAISDCYKAEVSAVRHIKCLIITRPKLIKLGRKGAYKRPAGCKLIEKVRTFKCLQGHFYPEWL